MKYIIILSLAAGLLACTNTKQPTSTYDTNGKFLNIPKISDINIDGNIDDWKNNGSTVYLYSDYKGNTIAANDFSANFSLGWTDSALLISLTVIDDTLFSQKNKKSDVIELFFIDNIRGKNKVQYIITPDFTTIPITHSIVEWDHQGSRKVAGKPMNIQAAFQKNEEGYTFEASIPFSIVDLQVEKGAEAGFEIVINDTDDGETTKTLAWSYVKESYLNNYALNRIILSDKKEENIFETKSYVLDADSLHIIIHAPKNNAGKELCVYDTAGIIAKTFFRANSDIAIASAVIPYNQPAGTIGLFVDKENIGVIDSDIANLEHKNTKALPHENYIRYIQRKNTLFPAPEKPIIFIGHSMFRYWNCFEDDMTGFAALNHAFGGSKSDQVLLYYDVLIKPFNPKAIVYFEGSNDYRTGVPSDIFINNVKSFVEKARTDFPEIKIFILSPDFRDEKPEYNKQMKNFIAQHSDYIEYVNLEGLKRKKGDDYQFMLLPDNTHWNALGYEYLTSVIRETLKEYKD